MRERFVSSTWNYPTNWHLTKLPLNYRGCLLKLPYQLVPYQLDVIRGS